MTEPALHGTPPDPSSVVLRNVAFWLTVVSIASITFSVAISSMTMGVAIGLWLIIVIRSGGRAFRRTPLDVLFLAYAAIEILVAFFSPEPFHSIYNAKRLILILFVYLVTSLMDDRKRLALAVGVLAAVAGVTSFLELFSLTITGGHILRLSMFQYFLTEGGIKMIALLLMLPFIIDRKVAWKWRLIAGAAAIPVFAGLILTQTRSSWLGFIGGVVTLGLLKNKALIIGLIITVLVLIAVAPTDLRSRAASIFDPTMTSNLTRIHMIETGWRMFLDRPLTGFGDIDLRQYYVTYITPLDTAEGGHLHNNFMMLLVTLGGIGFLVVMVLFIKIGILAYRSVKRTTATAFEGNLSAGCFAGYIGFHINGLFEWNFGDHEIALLLWMMVGMMIVSERIANHPHLHTAAQ